LVAYDALRIPASNSRVPHLWPQEGCSTRALPLGTPSPRVDEPPISRTMWDFRDRGEEILDNRQI